MADHPLPTYRLHADDADGFIIDRVDAPEDPDDDAPARTIAAVRSRESALAVLRLVGAEVFHDCAGAP